MSTLVSSTGEVSVTTQSPSNPKTSTSSLIALSDASSPSEGLAQKFAPTPKSDTGSKWESTGKTAAFKPPAAPITSIPNDVTIPTPKLSKTTVEIKSPPTASHTSSTTASSVLSVANTSSTTAITQTSSKPHGPTKKKKEVSAEPSTITKHETATTPTDSARPLSPPKPIHRKTTKSFTRSSSSVSGENLAVSKDSVSHASNSNSSSSSLIVTVATSMSTPSSLEGDKTPSNASTQSTSISSEELPRRKDRSKKRKSVKDITTGSILDAERDRERDASPNPRLLSTDDPGSVSHSTHAVTIISTIPTSSHTSSHSASSGSASSTLESDLNTVSISSATGSESAQTASTSTSSSISSSTSSSSSTPKMRKTTSSTFKDSLVSLITSPVKKKPKKGEESDGEKDDSKIVSKDSNSKESNDLKERDGSASKESNLAARDTTSRETTLSSLFSTKEKEKEKGEKGEKEKDRDREKDREKDKDKEKDATKDKDREPVKSEGLLVHSALSSLASSSSAVSLTSGGSGSASSSQSNSPVVTFAKKHKKMKKKTGATTSKKKTPKICYLQSLPVELILKLLCCLDVYSLVKMGTTAKIFRGICGEPFVWHVVAVKMMRAGQRKPRIVEWRSYCKSIWCFRRGISLDADHMVEPALSTSVLKDIEAANKALKVHSANSRRSGSFGAGSAPGSSRTSQHNLQIASTTATSQRSTTATPQRQASTIAAASVPGATASSTASTVSHVSHHGDQSISLSTAPSAAGTLESRPEDHVDTSPSSDAASSSQFGSSSASSSIPHVVASPALMASATSPKEAQSGEDDGSLSTATLVSSSMANGSDNVSNSEDTADLSSASPSPVSNAIVWPFPVLSFESGLENLFAIIQSETTDLQTHLALNYPFLFADDDCLDLRICATLPSLFKIKQTISSTHHNVIRAVHMPTREMVTIVKVPYTPGMKPTTRSSDQLRLVKFLKTIDYPYLVSFYGNYFDGKSIWYVSEYCTGGSCRQHLDSSGFSTFAESEMAFIARDVLRALAVLHMHGFIHGNISASALMLSELRQGRSVVKLRVKTLLNALEVSKNWNSTTLSRKAYWRAPEDSISAAMDIWSLGITFIELAEGRPPGWNLQPTKARSVIVNSPPPGLRHPTSFSPKFRSFLDHCLVKDPLTRPTAAQLLSHPFISDNPAIAKKANNPSASRAKLTRFNSSPLSSTSSSITSSRASATTSSAAGEASARPTSRSRKVQPNSAVAAASTSKGSNTASSVASSSNHSGDVTKRGRAKKSKAATADSSQKAGPSQAPPARPSRPSKITRRLSYAGSASTSDTMTHPYLSDSEDNISFALTHSSSRLSFSWSEDWASGSVDVSIDSSKH